MPPQTRRRPGPPPRRTTRRAILTPATPEVDDATPEVEDAAPDIDDTAPDIDNATPARSVRPGPPRQRSARLVALTALAVLLGGFAVFAGLRASHLHGSAAAGNTALTDNATTSTVNGQITTAVNTIFSYDYTKLDATQQAARQFLVDKAICQYDTLFRVVRQQAPQQQLVVTITVTNSGVEMVIGDRARLLIFATQSSTSAVTKKTSTAGAMFAVDAVRRDGRWRIANIDTFTGDQSAGGCG